MWRPEWACLVEGIVEGAAAFVRRWYLHPKVCLWGIPEAPKAVVCWSTSSLAGPGVENPDL